MSDINDNLDESIPFINITDINVSSLEKFKQKLESDDFQKYVEHVFLPSDAINKTLKPEVFLDNGVLYAKDKKKLYKYEGLYSRQTVRIIRINFRFQFIGFVVQ
ncbi:hypothetical protein [Nostoc sp. WHI]|uniref:hypothetical protein n=1 Tax=Nostoc sp. WHI TaxID=2650611 RepID=UPI0018C850BE|nr:hypothetical protein [Nostoc sp. WHI]MBG1265520.1 hypothetical protein [Nostoc sp. WHI]